MSADSPNKSTITISPLVTNKRSKDFFATPPAAGGVYGNAIGGSSRSQGTNGNNFMQPPAYGRSGRVFSTPGASLSRLSSGSGSSQLQQEQTQQGHEKDQNTGLSSTKHVMMKQQLSGPSNFEHNPIRQSFLSHQTDYHSMNDLDSNRDNQRTFSGDDSIFQDMGTSQSAATAAANRSISQDTSTNNNNNKRNPQHNSAESEEEVPLTQAQKLRIWRHDALLQHHYETSIYIGDKVLSLTNDPNDVFWLAQVHYMSGNYLTARNLLSKPEFENSVSCRYLAGLCLMKLEQWDEALDVTGEVNPFKTDRSIKNPDGGIKLEASMCYLRGQIYAKQNNFERAKECYKEAVLVDAKCYEAFNELIKNHLMTPDEEWELLSLIDFDDADNNGELVKLLYTTRLNKYKNVALYEEAEQTLKDEYNLNDNVDVLLSRADLLFIQCKFQQCLDICEKIIEKDSLNLSALPNYLSCLHELGGKNKLFLTAHKLAENYPNNCMTWLAIGIYYFSIKKTTEARLFFSKASMINPSFGPAWIGFAHTFAAEGEHEQAISAYATASRLFPGIHLPNLFLGMQYLQINNLTLANEYLNASYSLCSTDPLLFNELGVLNYHKNQLAKAESFFIKALHSAKNLDSDSKTWASIHCNLGHVYRRSNRLDESLKHFNKVLKITNDVNVFSAVSLVYLKLGKLSKAIETLHIALSLSPDDPVASDLLKKALETSINYNNNNFFNKTEEIIRLTQDSNKYTDGRSDFSSSLSNRSSRATTTREATQRFTGGGKSQLLMMGNSSLNTAVDGIGRRGGLHSSPSVHPISSNVGSSGSGSSKFAADETPTGNPNRNRLNVIGQGTGSGSNSLTNYNSNQDLNLIIEDLKRGEDSSDEDDEIMEIESE
ncbi:hypothetical protein BVG19_g2338 [[Candida] boidinii]|nr:hypothetical protein BVG19_g2338 [[Candida] boidinii]OWB48920.1 hypothetical protein B5S27_g457 [[Candida] boidinii]OWB86782.1 hypothetical protein B5S33_g5496 [[Candida] boidinii]